MTSCLNIRLHRGQIPLSHPSTWKRIEQRQVKRDKRALTFINQAMVIKIAVSVVRAISETIKKNKLPGRGHKCSRR